MWSDCECGVVRPVAWPGVYKLVQSDQLPCAEIGARACLQVTPALLTHSLLVWIHPFHFIPFHSQGAAARGSGGGAAELIGVGVGGEAAIAGR